MNRACGYKDVEIRPSGRLVHVERGALHDVRRPARRRGFRIGAEEDDIADEDASDDGVLTLLQWSRPIAPDPPTHLSSAWRAVRFAEELPSLRQSQRGEPAEEPSTDNAVAVVCNDS